MSPIEKPKAENVPELADKFPKSRWQAVLGVLDLVSKLPLRLQLLLASFGLVVALVCGWQLQTVLFNNQNNLARTLAATLVSTAYPQRGVTALLTAELDKNTGSQRNNKDLSDAVKAITENIKNLKTFDKGLQEKVIQDLDLRVMDKPDIPKTDKDRTWTQIIYSKKMEGLQRPAFLMVPAISLRQSSVGDNTLKNDQQLKQILHHNPEILFDFYVASQIDDQLDALGRLPHQQLTIVQAYFISESGVILLRQLPDSKSYKQTFPNNTLFMDRLYFWGAINPDEFRQEKNDDGPLDYETEPYIDLGGNGVVKTNSKRVELPNKRTGVICVDVVIPETEQQIEARLRQLGATVKYGQYVESLVNPDQQSKGRLEVPEAESGFDWVNQLGKTPTSRITGAIAFESDFRTRTASDPKVVRFTVPIAGGVNNSGEPVTKLLLVTFNFRSISLWTYILAAGLVLGIGSFIFVMGNLLLQYTSLTREMNRVLVNMSKVMYEADTPFAWLNENNEFEEVNLSFLKVVGCKTMHELKDHAPRFKDLVSADTRPIYEEILERSAAGEPTPKYRIKIVRLDDEVVAVCAHGERVPYPTLGRKRPPHRFGVFLPDRETDLDQGEAAAKNSENNIESLGSVKTIRFGIDGPWTAYEMARFILTILNLYDLRLLMHVYPDWVKGESFASAIQAATSTNEPVQGHFSKTISDREGLKVLRIKYGSSGIADLTGLGAIVGHVKDFIFKLIDLTVTSEQRELEISERKLNIKQRQLQYSDALVNAEQNRRETELKLERIKIENEALRIESVKTFVELAREIGISQMGDVKTITESFGPDETGKLTLIIKQVGMEHLEQFVYLEQEWLIALIKAGKIRSVVIL